MATEAALAMSLDDLIAQSKKKQQDTKAQKQKRETRKGNRPGDDDRQAPRGRGGRKAGAGNLSISIKGRGDAIAKPRRGGSRMLVDREDRREERQDPAARAAALEGDAKWGHDLYRGPRGGAREGRGRRDPRAPTDLGTKLFISNLHYNVSEDDIKELFETCGTLVKHQLHYDESGRSEGTAEVIYERFVDADKAKQQYNNVQLDGQPMHIELIQKAAQGEGGTRGGNGGRTLKSGIRISGGARLVQMTRSFQQATGGAAPAPRPRGRGSVRAGGVAAMQE